MGTSKGYGGPSSGLVPSWIDDVAQPAGPALNRMGLGNQIHLSLALPRLSQAYLHQGR